MVSFLTPKQPFVQTAMDLMFRNDLAYLLGVPPHTIVAIDPDEEHQHG